MTKDMSIENMYNSDNEKDVSRIQRAVSGTERLYKYTFYSLHSDVYDAASLLYLLVVCMFILVMTSCRLRLGRSAVSLKDMMQQRGLHHPVRGGRIVKGRILSEKLSSFRPIYRGDGCPSTGGFVYFTEARTLRSINFSSGLYKDFVIYKDVLYIVCNLATTSQLRALCDSHRITFPPQEYRVEAMKRALKVHAYCLPGREDEVSNTSLDDPLVPEFFGSRLISTSRKVRFCIVAGHTLEDVRLSLFRRFFSLYVAPVVPSLKRGRFAASPRR